MKMEGQQTENGVRLVLEGSREAMLLLADILEEGRYVLTEEQQESPAGQATADLPDVLRQLAEFRQCRFLPAPGTEGPQGAELAHMGRA